MNNEINGWQLYMHPVFHQLWDELKNTVIKLKEKDPEGYKRHFKTKLLASLHQAVTMRVPNNPAHKEFVLGNTLGTAHRAWRRVKNGLPQRYRLFFRFASRPLKIIVYVWFNGDDTLRKAGAKKDVYEVFKRVLRGGDVPASMDELLNSSEELETY